MTTEPDRHDAAIDAVVASWRDAGVAYEGPGPREGIQPSLDLERLLLRSVAVMGEMPRLFNTTASWLHAYSDLVARHRLRRLAASELDRSLRPLLGALLETAEGTGARREFATVVAELEPASQPHSPFAVSRRSPALERLARERGGAIGRRWRLYIGDEPLRPKVLRSSRWVMGRHPDFVIRADFKGDLRASVMASLWFDEGAGESELSLARACGGSRAQVRRALDNLEMTGKVSRRRHRAGTKIEALQPEAAAAGSDADPAADLP